MSWTRLMVVLAVVGCGSGGGLAPTSVASPWVTQALEKEPDVVVSVDIAALRRDPFFGKLVDLVMADAPLPYDAVRGARRIDLFGTVQASRLRSAFTAIVYGAGALTPELQQCIERDTNEHVSVSAVNDRWVVSSGQPTGTAPDAIHMDSDALFEAWLGPGAVDAGLARARWDVQDLLWRHLYALRMRIEGGGTPGLVVDAHFETSVDAEHAVYDFARVKRALEGAVEAIRDEELAKQMIEQLPNFHVARSGADVRVDFHLTPGLTQYVSKLLDRDPPRRVRDRCSLSTHRDGAIRSAPVE
jgi:hypothetical protein